MCWLIYWTVTFQENDILIYIYIYIYYIILYVYIYTAIQELKVFFYRKAVSKMIFIDFWWSKTFKNHTKPEFPLDWHNQSIDAAQATDQVTASLADNLGRLGHHEATVRDPGGSATTRLPFGNLTVLYGKPSFIFIYIYECFTGRHNHHSRTKWAVASIFMWKLFNDLRITLYILIQWYIGWADGPQWRTFFREETTKSASNGSYKPSSNKQFDYILGSPFCHVFLVCQDMWMLRNSGIKKRFVDKEDTVQAKM